MTASPGPWGEARAARRAAATSSAATASSGHGPEYKGQSLPWAIASTALLGAVLWYFMGWVVALAGVVGVFVHEYGHVLAMNRAGMGPAKIVIVPFFGGAAVPQRPEPTEYKGIVVSLAGPVFGLLAAIPFFAAGFATGDDIWLKGAAFVAFINLVNLAPIPPLDGSKALGPVLARVHPMLEKAGLLVAGVGAVILGAIFGYYIMAVFVAIAVLGYLKRGAWRPASAPLNWGQAGGGLAMYVGALLLCLGALAFAVMGLDVPLMERGLTTAGLGSRQG